jgi:DNA segregation ATPase FtsK/SpoIIIE-like protein
LAARYRAQGPPTLLHWALQTLAYSASFQGRTEEADELFDEAAAVDVPDRTLSAGDLVQARTLFRRGQRQRAFQTLRSYVQEQLDTDNVIAASVVAIEFITMMAAINRLSEASHILEYLKTANDFGALAAETLVADAAAKLTADPETGPRLDDRQALAYMRAVLDQCVS